MSSQHEPEDARPDQSGPGGPADPVSGQPWPTPSGDPLSPDPSWAPPSYQPGYAAVPEAAPEYPPTASFPSVNYAPPGHPPDYGGRPAYGPPPYAAQPGHGGYPPPAHPGYDAPPPAPRKSNLPLIAVIVAVTLLLCGGVATAGVLIARNVTDRAKEALPQLPTEAPQLPTEAPRLPTEVPDLPGLPTELPGTPSRQISVTYEVTGDGPAQILYLDRLGGSPVRRDDVKLPWRFTTKVETPVLLSVMATRIGTDEGQLSCRTLVDGAEVERSSSRTGTVATVFCSHFALD